MTEKNNGGPAFPLLGYNDGMSLRDYFAAKAMQGMLSNPAFQEICKDFSAREAVDYTVIVSYGLADAMIERREK